jgi:hypothetical protein
MKLNEKIKKHLGQCAPHQRDRQGYVILQEALIEIERLELELKSTKQNTQRYSSITGESSWDGIKNITNQ